MNEPTPVDPACDCGRPTGKYGPHDPDCSIYNGRAYGGWCRKPEACKGKGYCPLDPTCGD